MQRNINNEIIAAIIAIGILTLALIAASLLANTFEDESIASNEAEITEVLSVTEEVSNNVSSQINTSVPIAITSNVEVLLLVTITPTTVIPTDTVTPTVTETAIPTQTAIPTDTVTSTVTETSTATSTQTKISTEIVLATETPIKPTSTTAPSSVTTTAIVEAVEALRSSETPTQSNDATETLVPSQSPTLIHTATAKPTDTETPQASATVISLTPSIAPLVGLQLPEPSENCVAPENWVEYHIRPTDTLYGIAVATDTSIYALRIANCITDDRILSLEDTIFVPKKPVADVPVIRPVYESDDLATIGCDFPELKFTNLVVGQLVGDILPVYGTMQFMDVGYYAIEVRPDAAEDYIVVFAEDIARSDELLYTINTTLLPNGINWLRLIVVDVTGQPISYATCEIPVIVE